MHTHGGTIAGAYATLTALPFKDYLNFAVGAAIQEYEPIKEILSIRPNEMAIKSAFEGRTRCPASYYEGWTVETCPEVNTADGPPFPPGREPGLASACDPSSSSQHVPTDFGLEPYIPPYMMDDPMPDRAIWNFEAYKEETDVCESICRFSESFCEHKGWLTGCNEDRRRKLQVEKANKKASHDEWGNAINWNVYLDPWDPDNEDKN